MSDNDTQQQQADVAIGALAPDFRLTAHTGDEISLSDFRGSSAVVLFFVREYG